MNSDSPTTVATGGVLQRINWWAQHAPHLPALTSVDGSQTYTYSELVTTVSARAGALKSHSGLGAKPGARILVVSDSSVDAYLDILACMWAGGVVAVADVDAPDATMQAYAETVSPDLVLNPAATRDALCDALNKAPGDGAQGITVDRYTASADGHRRPEVQGDSLPVPSYQAECSQVMLFTSGTTGTPKAVVLPQQSFLAVPDLIRRAGLDWIDWRSGEVTYTPLPSSHIGGLWWSFNGLAAGCHLIAGRTHDVLNVMQRWRVNTTCLVPTLMGMLVSQIRQGRVLPPDLRLVVYGGSRAIAQDVAELEQRAVRTAQIYGLSETGCTAVCLPTSPNVAGSGRSSLDLIESGAVGQPYPGVELCVLADPTAVPPNWEGTSGSQSSDPGRLLRGSKDVPRLHPASDAEGTLWIRTPARMTEYFGNAEQTEATISDGWVNTGDRVAIERVGADAVPIVHLRGRVSELIICGGANVNPDDVDAIARDVPGVRDAAAFSIPDDTFGELVCIAVVPADSNADEAELRGLRRDLARHFRAHATPESRPAHIDIVDSLPRTASGKLRRHELQKLFCQRMNAQPEDQLIKSDCR